MNMRLKVFRYDPERDKEPYYHTYEVEAAPADRLLDCLNRIRWEQDPTLAFRMSCGHGICGSDGMRINGICGLPCRKLAGEYAGEVLIEPLPVFPVIKDLVVDLDPFFEKYRSVKPYLIARTPAPVDERRQSHEEQSVLEDAVRCILCGCCTASCPVNQAGETADYAGPAALVRAFRYLFDSRDEGTKERIILLDTEQGAWGCKTLWKCTEVCPRQIPVTKQIGRIKARIFEARKEKGGNDMETHPAGTDEYKMFIGGEWVDAAAGNTFDSLNPYTGQAWARMPDGQAEDVDRAVGAARTAFTGSPWGRMRPAERADLMRRFADRLRDNAEHLAGIETRDNGKLIREMLGQARALPGYYHYYAGLTDKIMGETIPQENSNIFNYTLREPVGVVAIVTPWNSPLLILSFSLAAVLACGNTVVVKPSEYASASTLEFARIVEAAGFPPGVFNVVTGFGKAAGSALVGHPGVDKVVFTGGAETGRAIGRTAAGNITPVLMELGGKSPNIVFDDAVIPNAVNGCIAGIFAASGQTCLAGSRLLLHEKIHDAFMERLVARVKTIRLGDPSIMDSEMGPIATTDQLRKVEGFVESALTEGAKLVYGGHRPEDPALGRGWFFMPTIFDDVRNDMYLAREEVFGPVLAVLTFKDEEEAVALANASQYGLAAGIWTNDVKRAHRVARRLAAGTVWINTYRALTYASPFGGYKQSGYGREMGLEAIREFTQVKSVWVDLAETVPDPFVIR